MSEYNRSATTAPFSQARDFLTLQGSAVTRPLVALPQQPDKVPTA
jgi:hypothetical protein